MTEKVLNLYKKIGETPLACINRFKEIHPEYGNAKMSYAGRLDPMAGGVLLVLVGEENKNKEKYLKLEKAYTFNVLFGIETDTYDVLGMVKNTSLGASVNKEDIKQNLKSFEGEFEQTFPPYSSKPIDGKPSFVHAREGKSEAVQPSKNVLVRLIELKKLYQLSGEEILQNIVEKVSRVKGDFRQEEILDKWKKEMNKNEDYMFTIATVDIVCGSGTYVRSIARELGKKLGTGALAYSIFRTRVGEQNIKHSIRSS